MDLTDLGIFMKQSTTQGTLSTQSPVGSSVLYKEKFLFQILIEILLIAVSAKYMYLTG